jgi:fructose-specific phosphotransferase system IIC component
MSEYKDLLKKTRAHLMTGVSYMIPVILAGALHIAISLILTQSFKLEGPFADAYCDIPNPDPIFQTRRPFC